MRLDWLTYFQPGHHILRRGHVMVTEPYVTRCFVNGHVTNQGQRGGQRILDKRLRGRVKPGHTVGGSVTNPDGVSRLIDLDDVRLGVLGRRGPLGEGFMGRVEHGQAAA